MKPTYNPSKIKRKKTHGFFARMKSATGQNLISRRRKKGRKKLTA
ncbi:MAG: 50S ribosomal protein L34 [Spiroplasma sp.]